MSHIELIAIQASPKMGEPMVSHESISLVQDKGLSGDRYEQGMGAYSKSPRKNVPPELELDRDIVRDVSLIAIEAIIAANAEFETDFTFADTRRNLLIQGQENLESLIGVIFTIGAVAFLGIEACDPCERPSKLSGKKGFNEAFQSRGGLRAQVLNDGEIKVGDELVENQQLEK